MLNPFIQYVAINAAGGGLTPIALQTMARIVEVEEDPAQNGGNLQGLAGNYVDPLTGALTPAVAGAAQWPPTYQPIKLGDPRSVHGGLGIPAGAPGATVLKLVSMGLATKVIVREWP